MDDLAIVQCYDRLPILGHRYDLGTRSCPGKLIIFDFLNTDIKWADWAIEQQSNFFKFHL